MTELAVNRVVIACDSVGENRSAIEAAARLAACWNVVLHGVFVEDEGLLSLAALPFNRHIAPGGGISDDLDVDAVLHQFAAHAERVRAALEAAARAHDLGWSFAVVRGHANTATLALDDRDLLVIEAASRPFVDFRLDSRWLTAAFDAHRPILLIRNAERRNAGVVAVVQRAGAAAERILATAARLAVSNDCRLTVLLANAITEDTVRAQIRGVSAKIAANCRIERSPALTSSLRRLDGEGALVVIDADPATNSAASLRDLAAQTNADILFLR